MHVIPCSLFILNDSSALGSHEVSTVVILQYQNYNQCYTSWWSVWYIVRRRAS